MAPKDVHTLQSLLLDADYKALLEQSAALQDKAPKGKQYMLAYYRGIAHSKMGNAPESIREFEKCRSLLKRGVGIPDFVNAFVRLELASACNNANQFDNGIDFADEALKQFSIIDDPIGLSRALYAKGTALLCMNRYSESIDCLEEAIRKSRSVDVITYIRASLNISTAKSALSREEEVIAVNADILDALNYCDAVNSDKQRIESEGMIVLSPVGYCRTMYSQTISYRSIACGALTTLYDSVGLYDQSLVYASMGIELARRSNNSSLLAMWENNIAQIYLLLGQFDTAKTHLDQARLHIAEHSDISIVGNVELNAGKYYTGIEEFDKAVFHFDKACQIFESYSNNSVELAGAMYNKALLYTKRNDYAAAKDLTNRALKLAETFESENLNILLTIELGKILFYEQDEESIPVLESAFAASTRNKFMQEELTVSTLLAKAYTLFGHKDKALDLYNTCLTLKEKIFSAQAERQLSTLSITHKIELLRKDYDILSEKQATLQLERERLQEKLTMKTNAMLEQLKAVNKLRSEVLSSIVQVDAAETILREVKKKLSNSPILRQDWEVFMELFNQVHPHFSAVLLEKYPKLTKTEVQLCTLIRSGMTTDDIAQFLSLSDRSIENHRLRIRKKLSLKREENLYSTIRAL